jgi:hypothetical protein
VWSGVVPMFFLLFCLVAALEIFLFPSLVGTEFFPLSQAVHLFWD